MSKIEMGFNADGAFELKVDTNEDGEPVAELKIRPGEILDEVMSKLSGGEEIEMQVPAQMVTLRAVNGRFEIAIDSNLDGEESVILSVNVGEIIEEVRDLGK